MKDFLHFVGTCVTIAVHKKTDNTTLKPIPHYSICYFISKYAFKYLLLTLTDFTIFDVRKNVEKALQIYQQSKLSKMKYCKWKCDSRYITVNGCYELPLALS
jgi:hypothetical protein